MATSDGRLVTGLVKAETDEPLTLVDGEAREHVIPKSEIEDRKFSDVSIMPEGLATGLSREQFADLIAYLETLRSAGQPTPGSGTIGPVSLPPGFTMEKVVGGLSAATALAIAADGRVFVCEQTGSLRVIKHGQLLPEPFVTLRVDHFWERGLIGVALDPSFSSNGFLYVTYVSPDPYPHHRISRFTAAGDVAVPGSEVVLLEGDDQRKLGGSVPAGHQGGALHFGKDGKLYVAIGEQTAGSPAQSLDTFQGKLLRINPDGTIPAGQPLLHDREGKVPRHLGTRPAQSVHVRRPARDRPHLHQRRGPGQVGRGQRRLRRRQLRLARVRRRDAATHGSARRSTSTRSPRSPVPPSAREAQAVTFPPSIKVNTSSWISSRAGSRSSTPTTPRRPSPSPRA